jgi:DNA-binding NarL/FixJ family response regulator
MAEKSGNTGKEAKKESFVKELISGSMMTDKIILKNFGYVMLLTLLAAIYIGNRFHAEKITRATSRLTREVRDLRAESLSTSSDLMFMSRQSEVIKMIKEKGLDLEELKTPPFRLIVDNKKK